ncbi:MAG: hypothetical protein ACI8QD_002842 [Cyclobacteriaceae bacterium]|jgi:hypothetical protein
MVKKILLGIGAVLLLLVGYALYIFLSTSNLSPTATATYQGSSLKVDVVYSQPSKRDRLIFGAAEEGALQPYGQKWRTGANEATQITFSEKVMLDGEVLKAGTYSLYSYPGPEEWTIVFNSNVDYWGAGIGDPFDESKDVLRIKVPVMSSIETVELFTISFEELMDNNAIMNFSWDKTQFNVPVSKL